MLTFIVDWDGTCTENKWPDQGEWLPGAVEALKELLNQGKVIIFSCRTSPYWLDYQPRDPSNRFMDICRMRQMLDDAGLEDVELFLKTGKPAGHFYIDDRAITHTSWEDTLAKIGSS